MKYFALILPFIALSCADSAPENSPAPLEVTSEKIEQHQPEPVQPATAVIKPGQYVEYHASGGIKMKGVYNDQLEREGLWIAFYEDGTKWSESYYSHGELDGHTLTFYPNGNVRYIGEYRNGEPTGTWTFYDENGDLTKEEKY